MKADGCHQGVEGVSEPGVKLVWGGGERGRSDAEFLQGAFQAFPVSLVPHGSGGGACVRRRGEVDEDGDVVRSGGGQGGGIPGLDSWADEGVCEG